MDGSKVCEEARDAQFNGGTHTEGTVEEDGEVYTVPFGSSSPAEREDREAREADRKMSVGE
jgi:hypothetical protein